MKGCPEAEQLLRLLDDALDETEQSTVEDHVQGCGRCHETLEELTRCHRPVRQAWGNRAGRVDDLVEHLLQHLSPAVASSTLRQSAAALKHPADGDPALPDVPGYEILGELGRGGMGVVYRARHLRLNRFVALKMIAGQGGDDPRRRARFRAEAEAVARLHHPNIVQVYEVDETQGRPYLALEYVGGGSLREWINAEPQPPDAAVRLIETLARAVHIAHLRGIVHRDLKPANILMSSEVERETEEREPNSSLVLGPFSMPKITDFGLAKQLDPTLAQSLTETGAIVGSPGYMAPEQAAPRLRAEHPLRPEVSQVGPAVDIHALGAILYDLLTGRPPYRGQTAVDTVISHANLGTRAAPPP